jgi:hypothetical protein
MHEFYRVGCGLKRLPAVQAFGRNHRISNDGALVARERPDAVLVLLVERNLKNLLWPQDNAAQTCAR